MSNTFYRKKIIRKKLEFARFLVGSGSGTGPGSVIPEADPRFRIRIEMNRIRNTGKKTVLWIWIRIRFYSADPESDLLHKSYQKLQEYIF